MQALTSVGWLARALAVFCVDEVVVFDDFPRSDSSPPSGQALPLVATTEDPSSPFASSATSLETDPGLFATHLLSYLECPPFMRKTLFPLHPNLRQAGLLPSLDMPHHPNPQDAALAYREGVVVDDAEAESAGVSRKGGGPVTVVDVGAITAPGPSKHHQQHDQRPKHLVTLHGVSIAPRTRVTLHFPPDGGDVEAVDPAEPRTVGGLYWGYSVRRAGSLSAAVTESPFVDDGGYDLTIGTSERGESVGALVKGWRQQSEGTNGEPRFKHLLVVFGGRRGLEYAAENDAELSAMGIRGARTKELFDHWVDVLPNQGSRTIRTDEAVLIALSALRPLWDDG